MATVKAAIFLNSPLGAGGYSFNPVVFAGFS